MKRVLEVRLDDANAAYREKKARVEPPPPAVASTPASEPEPATGPDLTHLPKEGDIIRFKHEPKTSHGWIVVSRGTVLDMTRPGTKRLFDNETIDDMKKFNYAPNDKHPRSDTWVFASRDPAHRNPKLLPVGVHPKWSSGDGEPRQVRGIVGVEKNQFFFHRFSSDQEISIILKQSKMEINSLYKLKNRMSETKTGRGGNDTAICRISEDLYYDVKACNVRLKELAKVHPDARYVFPTDPDYDVATPVLLPVTEAQTAPPPAAAAAAEAPPSEVVNATLPSPEIDPSFFEDIEQLSRRQDEISKILETHLAPFEPHEIVTFFGHIVLQAISKNGHPAQGALFRYNSVSS